MSEKLPVSFRAAVARYSRHIAKEGEKLIKFRTPMDSMWDYGIVNTETNVIKWKGTYENLLNWIAESGVMKPYEVIKDK